MNEEPLPWVCNTIEDYYARVHALKLRPTNVDTVFVDPEGNHVRVPRPTGMTAAQMRETLEMIRERAEMVKSKG
ncbi:hypothetical protein [Methyloceanibacter sp.]|uniref:hypothetical protein n=1 Tax=Methyloceanibacter sp. TaxID=1965321 RepID=UPI002D57D3F4|nr:hypothetical protein [Methyloceanibacter sp.]HZP08386.1 hypothetical protein [Methyloceanibacter sp.]